MGRLRAGAAALRCPAVPGGGGRRRAPTLQAGRQATLQAQRCRMNRENIVGFCGAAAIYA